MVTKQNRMKKFMKNQIDYFIPFMQGVNGFQLRKEF